MAFSMRDLLKDAVSRAKLSKEMIAVSVVGHANEEIRRLLPPDRENDARALSFRDGTLTVGCLNGGASALLSRASGRLLKAVSDAEPQAEIRAVRIRVVPGFADDGM